MTVSSLHPERSLGVMRILIAQMDQGFSEMLQVVRQPISLQALPFLIWISIR